LLREPHRNKTTRYAAATWRHLVAGSDSASARESDHRRGPWKRVRSSVRTAPRRGAPRSTHQYLVVKRSCDADGGQADRAPRRRPATSWVPGRPNARRRWWGGSHERCRATATFLARAPGGSLGPDGPLPLRRRQVQTHRTWPTREIIIRRKYIHGARATARERERYAFFFHRR
jgi:hypothetical protein